MKIQHFSNANAHRFWSSVKIEFILCKVKEEHYSLIAIESVNLN
jgi:hypothetical protein